MTNNKVRAYLPYAVLAAAVYAVFVYFFIYYQTYTQSWLLYLGNCLYGASIAFFLYRYYARNNRSLSLSGLIMAGQLTSMIGVVVACIFCFLLLSVFAPGFFMRPNTTNILHAPPEQLKQGKNSFTMIIFLDAVFGNIGAGSFIAILFPFTLFRNQQPE